MSQPDDLFRDVLWPIPPAPTTNVATPVGYAACFLCSKTDVPVFQQGKHLAYGIHQFINIGRLGFWQCQASAQRLCDLPPREGYHPTIQCHQETA